jgi:L-threonylcarbamoyladenylate synthase
MNNYLDLRYTSDFSKLFDAGKIICNGGVILFPTETVYGLGANSFNSLAVKKLYEIKGRSFKNPINVLVKDLDMINKIAVNISELEYKLIQAFCPGPFTIILHKRDIIPSIVTAGSDFMGVRMPSGKIAQKILEYSNVPIATPSANISGKTSGTCFDDIYEDFKDKVDLMINNGNSQIGIESTIVKVIDNVPHILRPGSITFEQIKKISGVVINDYNSSELPSSTLQHYTINSPSILIFSENHKLMINEIIKTASHYANPIILSHSEDLKLFSNFQTINIGSSLEEIAKNIFSALKKADSQNPDIVIVEGTTSRGIGTAIMNRLIKSCDKKIVF